MILRLSPAPCASRARAREVLLGKITTAAGLPPNFTDVNASTVTYGSVAIARRAREDARGGAPICDFSGSTPNRENGPRRQRVRGALSGTRAPGEEGFALRRYEYTTVADERPRRERTFHPSKVVCATSAFRPPARYTSSSPSPSLNSGDAPSPFLPSVALVARASAPAAAAVAAKVAAAASIATVNPASILLQPSAPARHRLPPSRAPRSAEPRRTAAAWARRPGGE